MPIARKHFAGFSSVICSLLLSSAWPASAAVAGGGKVVLYHLKPDEAKTICAAAAGLGLRSVETARQTEAVPADTQLIVFSSESDITAADAARLGAAVQNGAALLVLLGESAGNDAFVMSFMLPTTAWDWKRTDKGMFTATEFDPELFGSPENAAMASLSVPYVHQIRPVDARERGQARYDELEHSALFSGPPPFPFIPPGSNQWTRPLLNRDWQIRARLKGDLALPLLITGRYGRGRVAVFASGAEVLDRTPSGPAFWKSVQQWLLAKPQSVAAAESSAGISKPNVRVDQEQRTIHVEVQNASATSVTVNAIARVMSWEPAWIGDVQKPIVVPAKGKAAVDLKLPEKSDTSFAAVAARDEFDVRLGILSGDGSTLLSETRFVADPRPPLRMRLDTDDVRNYAWPFEPADKLDRENRMGTRMDEYAYKPGDVVHAQITFDNGTRNLAKLATAHDETRPDNPSTPALNDGFSLYGAKPDNALRAYGAWHGVAGADNVVSLSFPRPVLINAVHLIGSTTLHRKDDQTNPAAVIIEIDGKEVAREMKLPDRFLGEKGDVRIAFDAVTGQTVRLRLPRQAGGDREAPVIGDVQIWGTQESAFPPAATADVSLSLYDSFADKTTAIGNQKVSVRPGGQTTIRIDVPTPKTDGKPSFYRLEARCGDQRLSKPFMTIDPKSVLPSVAFLKGNNVDMGFIVTRGFRNIFREDTGTKEARGSWETPDDSVWAYEHGLKENGTRSSYNASKLFVTENDMRHYSVPWRHFYNGEAFFDVATPPLINNFKKQPGWNAADTASMGFSDRWDAGPPVMNEFSWPELIAFDQWLRSGRNQTLTGKTKEELATEINDRYLGEWNLFHLEQYEHSVDTMLKGFAAVGKKLLIVAQGCPLVPPSHAQTISQVFRGVSDDSTWGMRSDDAIATTAKQMGDVAFNPYLQMATLGNWQFVSATLNNQFWHFPVGSTEPSRRVLYNRAFRGVIRMDGSFTSMHSYGFNNNVGDPLMMTGDDYDDWKRVRDLHVLIRPESPLGAGIVIANSYLDAPGNMRFGGTYEGTEENEMVVRALSTLERAGVSIPFSANVLTLAKWRGDSPLLMLNLARCTHDELAILRATMARGVRVTAFWQGEAPLGQEAAELFGVDVHGRPVAGGQQVGTVGNQPIVSKGAGLLVPLSPLTMSQAEVDAIGPLLVSRLAQPFVFEEGSAGYGFVSNGRQFVVVDDWREEARTVHLRTHAVGNAAPDAVNVNGSVRLPVHREGDDWQIDIPTRPGDGNLICIQSH